MRYLKKVFMSKNVEYQLNQRHINHTILSITSQELSVKRFMIFLYSYVFFLYIYAL